MAAHAEEPDPVIAPMPERTPGALREAIAEHAPSSSLTSTRTGSGRSAIHSILVPCPRSWPAGGASTGSPVIRSSTLT